MALLAESFVAASWAAWQTGQRMTRAGGSTTTVRLITAVRVSH
ncbi:MAG: hypothetical protein WB770_06265 [Acidimicrobiales bacterium]